MEAEPQTADVLQKCVQNDHDGAGTTHRVLTLLHQQNSKASWEDCCSLHWQVASDDCADAKLHVSVFL